LGQLENTPRWYYLSNKDENELKHDKFIKIEGEIYLPLFHTDSSKIEKLYQEMITS